MKQFENFSLKFVFNIYEWQVILLFCFLSFPVFLFTFCVSFCLKKKKGLRVDAGWHFLLLFFLPLLIMVSRYIYMYFCVCEFWFWLCVLFTVLALLILQHMCVAVSTGAIHIFCIGDSLSYWWFFTHMVSAVSFSKWSSDQWLLKLSVLAKIYPHVLICVKIDK